MRFTVASADAGWCCPTRPHSLCRRASEIGHANSLTAMQHCVGPIGARDPKHTHSKVSVAGTALSQLSVAVKRGGALPLAVCMCRARHGSVVNAAATVLCDCTHVSHKRVRTYDEIGVKTYIVSQHIHVPTTTKIVAITCTTPSACRSPCGVSSVEAPLRAISCSLPTTCHATLPDVCTLNPSLVHTLCAQRIPAKFSPCRDPVALAPTHSAL